MSQKLLLIMNPVAGVKKSNKYLTDILQIFSANDMEIQVQLTTAVTGADKIVEKYAKDKDIVVCIGGDGTFNEMISGLIQNKLSPKIGYIPSGSTNDFANGLHISQNPPTAAKDIMEGTPLYLDAGSFNGRIFVYTSSFGIFTKTSYNTSRDLKNSLGYFAYVLEGTKEITNIKKYHLEVKCKEKEVCGDYIFGAVCNTRQIGGGLLKFDDSRADMCDGLLEVLLIKYPKNVAELTQIIIDAKYSKYDSNMFDFFSSEEITITTEDEIDWTIDGEYQKGSNNITIKSLKHAIPLLINKNTEK